MRLLKRASTKRSCVPSIMKSVFPSQESIRWYFFVFYLFIFNFFRTTCVDNITNSSLSFRNQIKILNGTLSPRKFDRILMRGLSDRGETVSWCMVRWKRATTVGIDTTVPQCATRRPGFVLGRFACRRRRRRCLPRQVAETGGVHSAKDRGNLALTGKVIHCTASGLINVARSDRMREMYARRAPRVGGRGRKSW